MKSRNLDYVPQLDHLRLVAAALVFLFHFMHLYYWKWQPQPASPEWGWVVEGHTGVALFFTLSGFLFMTIALKAEALDYRQFIKNRLLRIFPLFLFLFWIAIAVGRDQFNAADVFYLLFSNLGQAPTSNSFLTGAAWTISVEFTFYLIFPFLARFTQAQGAGYLLRLLLLLFVVKLGVYATVERTTHLYYSTLVGRLDQFLIGMLFALGYHHGRQLSQRVGMGVWVAAVGGLFVALAMQSRYASYFSPQPRQAFWIVWGTVEATLWGTVIYGYLHARLDWPDRVERFLRQGGAISYSFYMLHALVLTVLHHYIGEIQMVGDLRLNALLNGALAFGLVYGFAILSYQTLEKPFLDLRGRYVSAKSQ